MRTLHSRIMRAAGAIALAACTIVGACVTDPYDGETVASHPTTVIPKIAGYGNEPGQAVTIYAKNSSGVFHSVRNTTTGTTGWNWDGVTWYAWSVEDFDLPLAYWTDKPGGCGRKATLKVKIGDRYGTSVDQPHLDCWDINQTISEYLDACESDNSPNINIDTCGALCC